MHQSLYTDTMSNSTTIDGWIVTTYPGTNGTIKVIAVRTTSTGKKVALHVDKLSAEEVATFDPTARWGGPMAPRVMDPSINKMLA
jgi:hypothetical protein